MGDFLNLSISNSQNDVVCFEKKFPKDITIAELKVNVVKNTHRIMSHAVGVCVCGFANIGFVSKTVAMGVVVWPWNSFAWKLTIF